MYIEKRKSRKFLIIRIMYGSTTINLRINSIENIQETWQANLDSEHSIAGF